MEGSLWGLFGLMGGRGSALDAAQAIIYQALEAAPEEQPELARQALSVSPDCADAYVLLAEHAETMREAVELYEKGVAAGERAIGPEEFRQYEGHFWGVLETRPYMRARAGLARILREAGRREEAAEHYREMLRLNPSDNQGLRYELASLLLEMDRDEELGQLLDKYPDDVAAEFAYTRALAAFRRQGDSPTARKLLTEARKWNRHVPQYLVGNKPLSRDLPPAIQVGADSEAAHYAACFRSAWRCTPGALAWMRQVLRVSLARARQPKKKKLSASLVRQELLELPQREDEAWQVDALRVRPRDAAGIEHWVLAVVSSGEEIPVLVALESQRPTPSAAWDHVIQAMLKPKNGDPRRPASVQVRLKSLWTSWRTKAAELGIECVLKDRLEQVDVMFDLLSSIAERLEAGRSLSEIGAEVSRADLTRFPQHAGEVWQAHASRYPMWVAADGEPTRPWIALVLDVTRDLILAQDMLSEEPPADWLQQVVIRAVASPCVGQPHRPGVIEVESEAACQQLAPLLEPAAVKCVVRESLDQWHEILRQMGDVLNEPGQMAALIEVPGMPIEQVGRFFQAAADFYRHAPWRMVPGDTVIHLQCDRFESAEWYGVVMGQSGMVMGIALYEDLGALQEILSGELSDEENARRSLGLSVMFDEAFTIHPRDLEAAERYHWPVAGPEAYPCAIRVNPGGAVRPPLLWELELLEGVLRVVPQFLASRKPCDTLTVTAGERPLEVRLARMDTP